MSLIVQLFWQLSLLRKGPQDVPASHALLQSCVAVYLVVTVTTLTMGAARLGIVVATSLAVFEFALLVGFVYTLLAMRGFSARMLQTLTALVGTGVILGMLALPLSLWLGRMIEEKKDYGMPVLLTLGLLLWSLAVNSHILAQALASPRWVGTLYAIGYFFGSWYLTDLFVSTLMGG